jgi:hypothetical protein
LTGGTEYFAPGVETQNHFWEELMSNNREFKNLLRRAYRVAKQEGYILRKSRRAISPQNRGGLMLVDPITNAPVVGWDYDATPEEIVVYFALEHPFIDEGKMNAANAEASSDADELPADESDDFLIL